MALVISKSSTSSSSPSRSIDKRDPSPKLARTMQKQHRTANAWARTTHTTQQTPAQASELSTKAPSGRSLSAVGAAIAQRRQRLKVTATRKDNDLGTTEVMPQTYTSSTSARESVALLPLLLLLLLPPPPPPPPPPLRPQSAGLLGPELPLSDAPMRPSRAVPWQPTLERVRKKGGAHKGVDTPLMCARVAYSASSPQSQTASAAFPPSLLDLQSSHYGGGAVVVVVTAVVVVVTAVVAVVVAAAWRRWRAVVTEPDGT
jgi:hypothetical protein